MGPCPFDSFLRQASTRQISWPTPELSSKLTDNSNRCAHSALASPIILLLVKHALLHHGDQVCWKPCIWPAVLSLRANHHHVDSYLILLSRQGKVVSSRFASLADAPELTGLQRLAKWFTTLSPRDKAKIVKDVSQLVLARRTRMCNFLEYKGERFVDFTSHWLANSL
jgi:hypothetical protein